MKSVRLRLLVLALLPLMVLLPLLLSITMVRWTDKFDELLIAKVTSDLRIAEQYLQRIVSTSGDQIRSLAQSARFRDAMAGDDAFIRRFLNEHRQGLGMDFLTLVALADAEKSPWPVVQNALARKSHSAIDVFSASDLASISPALAVRAQLPLIPTEAAVPTRRTIEDRGMIVHTAARVDIGDLSGVLVGGILLNHNLNFIDTINSLVYGNERDNPQSQGTATLFLEDVRVSTNVRLFENVRALGTRVSAVVRDAVLDQGHTWLNRAFVVNDWYISGYLPIVDSFGDRVGMLYVGFLEQPYNTIKNTTYFAIVIAFIVVVCISVPFFLRLAQGIFSPLERMTNTMQRVEGGDLRARIGAVGSDDEIARVAGHLDTLLDQVQERDQALRDWAEQLNEQVDKRTRDLRTANTKLEATFRQLVMSEKLASIGEITAGVAHEINNPTAVIQGNTDVIRSTLGKHAQGVTTELDLIDQQVQRINIIVGKLLQFARPDDYSDFSEQVDVRQTLEDCLVLVQSSLIKASVEVVTDLQPVAPVQINRNELQQVLINLMINALQAMSKEGGTMGLYTRAESCQGKPGVQIEVCDNGPGIDARQLDQVFDPFYTTKPGEGSGLGLSISQTLIQRADGLITVVSSVGEGSRFFVWLPAVDNLSDTA